MSLRATLWALDDAPVDDPTQVLLLIAMADWANDEGRGIWPSMARIAARARVSERTAQRHLKLLCEAGVIARDPELNDPRYTAIHPRYRPSAWKLNLHVSRGDNLSTLPLRGYTGGTSGVTPASPNPSPNPTQAEPTVQRTSDQGLTVHDGGQKTSRPRLGEAERKAAEAVLKPWWERQEPRPLGNYVVARKAVAQAIAAGHAVQALQKALDHAHGGGFIITEGTLQRALVAPHPAGKGRRQPTEDAGGYDVSRY
jgi:hypothetical protein